MDSDVANAVYDGCSAIMLSGETAAGKHPVLVIETMSRIAEQAEQGCKNLCEVLKAAGTSIDKAVKTTCFLADMSDFAAFNAVYSKYITSAPARSCVAVKTLPKNALVEVEAVAVIG